MKDRIKHILLRILLPQFWVQCYKTDMKYSKKLEEQLDDPNSDIFLVDDYCVNINGVELWIKNYPYAYGHPYGLHGTGNHRLPAAHVRMKLKNIVEKFDNHVDNLWEEK